jgi:hypothetical protein
MRKRKLGVSFGRGANGGASRLEEERLDEDEDEGSTVPGRFIVKEGQREDRVGQHGGTRGEKVGRGFVGDSKLFKSEATMLKG